MSLRHYNRAQLAVALREVGVLPGQVVFSHSNIGYFGIPEEGVRPDAICGVVLGAFQDALGPEGTLVVPTFTYSFCKMQPFDPEQTPSTCGVFAEFVRRLPRASRSLDPIFSVAAIGGRAREVVRDVGQVCFGPESFWERFLNAGGLVCNLNLDAGSTFVHYLERRLNVPYRYDKLFPGTFIQNGISRKSAVVYFCQDMSNPCTAAAFERFDELARDAGIVRSAKVGRGQVVAIRAADTLAWMERQIRDDPWFLTVAGREGEEPLLVQPADTSRFGISLNENAKPFEIVKALVGVPRDLISDGYEAVLEALVGQIPMEVRQYPTGTHCGDWIIPEKWSCREVWVETMDGRRVFPHADHPLRVASYSLPFEGSVSRQELLAHLAVHPTLPDATPFDSKLEERNWGVCCSQRQHDALTDAQYRLVIRSQFSYGMLKVAEAVAPGKSAECILISALLDYTSGATGLSGVAVGIETMRRLLQRRDLHYTYRFVVLPEAYGPLVYVTQNRPLLETVRGGLFLDKLSLRSPLVLQLSRQGQTEMDQRSAAAVIQGDRSARIADWGELTGDDSEFSIVGGEPTMLVLSRAQLLSSPEHPYREYRSSLDNLSVISEESLNQSVEIVLRMVDSWEETADRARTVSASLSGRPA